MKASNSTNPLDLAYEAGAILLENGAEISRVEETMKRISLRSRCHPVGKRRGDFARRGDHETHCQPLWR